MVIPPKVYRKGHDMCQPLHPFNKKLDFPGALAAAARNAALRRLTIYDPFG